MDINKVKRLYQPTLYNIAKKWKKYSPAYKMGKIKLNWIGLSY